jgi:hypothetical protein
VGPIRQRWEIEHRGYEEGQRFEDHLLAGPFSSYQHAHLFAPSASGTSCLKDVLTFALPMGALGQLLGSSWIRRKLSRVFAYRHATTRADLSFWSSQARFSKMRIALTGATGMIGRSLVPFLTTQGHQVVRLLRRPLPGLPAVADVSWDPANAALAIDQLGRCDAVIHLAGRNIAEGRWTPTIKRELVESRVHSTRQLAQALAAAPQRPRVFVVASGVGIYGDRGDEGLSEESAHGAGFLADLCKEWEAAAEPARAAGIRVIHLRLGVVLDPGAGALARLLPIFRSGLGGRVGHGRQWMSWVALDDVLQIITFVLNQEALVGPINAVSPEPLRNSSFTQELGSALGRPAVCPVPEFALRLAFGEMADSLLIASARAHPSKLLSQGYNFRHASLSHALAHMLGKNTTKPIPS